MNAIKSFFKLIFIFFLLLSCSKASKPDLTKETNAILKLQEKQREIHFSKNANGFVNMFSPDYISINKGVIEKPAASQSFRKVSAYFNSVSFVKWDDVQLPIIRFSDDASIAYAAVDKLVVLKIHDESGKEKLDTTNFAWLAVYKKYNGEWKLDCVTSTNK